jgi:hypothetical protein
MSNHILMATIKPIENLKYIFERYNFSIGSGEEYRIACDLPLTLPYVYELYGCEKFLLLSFLEEYMKFGDVIELYEYWEGKALPKSINVPNEARTINLLHRTYKDELGEYQFDKKNWMNELATRTLISNRSVTTFVKY